MANLDEQETQFRSMFDPSTRTRRGMCPVKHQHESVENHSVYYEVHGSGPEKIVFIMGLNNSSFAWLPQVDHFGKLEQYSILVFDNRGVGMSGAPWGPYSSSAMAEDIICLLEHLQWTQDRSLHIVGVSLGGMIAQELTYRIADQIISLSLVVTRAGGSGQTNIPSWTSFVRFARLLTTSDPDTKIPIVQEILFPREWLDSLAEDDPEGRTNGEVQQEVLRRRITFTKPQPLVGALGQIAATLTHSMTPDRLAIISTSVPKVLILSAAEDTTIPYTEGERLKRYMPEAEYMCWEKTGHGLCVQHKKRFNQLLEKVFEEGSRKSQRN